MGNLYSPGEFEIAFDQEGLCMVRLVGDHDMATTRMLLDRVEELVNAGKPVVFDLSDATFIDSSVAHLLDHVRQETLRRGVPVVVVVPREAPTPIQRVLEASRMAERLPVVTATEEARRLLLEDKDDR
jgi:anti-anti-sigma factor